MATKPELFLERDNPVLQTEKPQNPYGLSDEQLLEVFREAKKESFENRWIWERGWMRNIHYTNNRHWIEYIRRTNEWRDVRLAKWFPKPVTPIIANSVRALRSMFAAVDIGVNVRPNGADPKNVAVAAIADDYGPVLHEEHSMDEVLNEGDFWFIVTGNVFYHTFFERDAKYGFDTIDLEQCLACETISGADEIAEADQKCPKCGAMEFGPGIDPETGDTQKKVMKGKGVTIALSPFELAYPATYARFEDVPYVIRLRWRSKKYYENHPVLQAQTIQYPWSKAPSETSLQLFRSLPFHNDIGMAPFMGNSQGYGADEEGAPEYEIWFRPCNQYPEGLVFRVLGDGAPILLHLEGTEALPGPIPYRDADDNPLFTFTHAPFEQRGGRVPGTSPLDGAIQKQNQLNQLDAYTLMIINRMGNPLWMVPKGSKIDKFTSEPGHIFYWDPLTSNGAEPKRIDGMGPNQSMFTIRDQYIKDIEEALGTSDVLKGSKPAGVEAFAALQLLVERGQSQFASAFKARGRAYRDWFKFALEIEREFGPDERTKWVRSPGRGWAQQVFDRADLSGSFQVIVEEGSQTPKTTLGIRAAIQHLHTLGFINPQDPDQAYAVFQVFGQTKLAPTLDIHMQAALRKQEEFEVWASDQQMQQESVMKAEQAVAEYEQELAAMPPPPQPAPMMGEDGLPVPQLEQTPDQFAAELPKPPGANDFTPLKWRPWYKSSVHRQEFMKWANGDSMIELMKTNPAIEELLVAHLTDMDMAAQQEMLALAPLPKPGGGAGLAMANSNQEAGGTSVMPGSAGAAQEPI